MITKKVNGFTVIHREGNNDDFIVDSVLRKGEYLKKMSYSNNDIWLDVGANIGMFALSVSSRVGKIYSYEPEPENFNIALKNINSNIDNAEVFCSAVIGGNEKKVDFFLGKSPMSYSQHVKRGRRKVTVNAENINDLIDKHGINCLKLDCEGAEYGIIKAVRDWGRIEKIVCEYHFNMLKDKNHNMYFEIMTIICNNFSITDYLKAPRKHWLTTFYAIK